MEELKKYRLGDLIDVTRGASLSGDNYATSGEYVRLTCGNFDYINNCFKENKSKENIYYIGSIREEFIMSEGDIITPLTEQAIGLLGSTALIPESNKYIQSQDIAKIVCKNDLLDHNYCFYLISSNAVKQQLSAGAQQTKIRHTSPDKIKDCTVWIPCIEKQKKIGNLLSNIDRLISTKRNENSTLEAMAKEIYDYWFVQFDFPNNDGKPYKSSGGKMVYNETLKREIPEGWEVKRLGEFLTIKNGKDHKHLDNGNFPVYGSGGFMRSVSQYLYEGESVLMPRKGSLNNVLYVNEAFWTVDTMFYSIPKIEHSAKYVYYSIKDIDFTRLNSGTGVPSMTSTTLYDIKLVKPSNELISQFDKILNPIYAYIFSNRQQIQNLTSLRDYLLPLLMNGQVEVKEAEKKFQEIFQKMPMVAEEEAVLGGR